DASVSVGRALEYMSRIGSKASDGIWRIQISGAITDEGVRFPSLPNFRRRLEIVGDDVAWNAVPTAVWDGTAASMAIALRTEGNCSPSVYALVRNIKFTNWNKTSLSGAMVFWDAGDFRFENIHAD